MDKCPQVLIQELEEELAQARRDATKSVSEEVFVFFVGVLVGLGTAYLAIM